MADPDDKTRKPQDWEKVISVAYLRTLGHTQVEAAEAAGVGERTIRDWESEAWWPAATAEACAKWLSGATAKARRAINAALDANDAQSARWLLERMEPALGPPKQRSEISGADGKPPGLVVRFIGADEDE
jgi:DNA-binding XRE family transcriptional regulator